MSKANNSIEVANEFSSKNLSTTDNSLFSTNKISTWMSEDYFQSILKKQIGNETTKVKSIRVETCSGKGKGNDGLMFRVGVNFHNVNDCDKKQFRSFIVKTMPKNAIISFGKNEYNVHGKEMEFYQQIEIEFRKILKSINEDGNIFSQAANVDNTLEVIVLEDLMEKDFVMIDHFKGLDKDHIKMVLRKLARMHAASVVLHEKNPIAFKNFDMGMYTRKTDIFYPLTELLYENFVNEVASWEGYEYYAEKLRKASPHVIENALKCFDCEDGDFHVLTHGDLWFNNMMFKYDNASRVIDCVLFDLQFSSYASPAIDLLVSTKNEGN